MIMPGTNVLSALTGRKAHCGILWLVHFFAINQRRFEYVAEDTA
jgi:hypothetical protein